MPLQIPEPEYKGIFGVLGDNDNFLKLLLEVLAKQFCAPAPAAARRGVFSAGAGRAMGGHNALCCLGHVRGLWDQSDAPAFPQSEGGPQLFLNLMFASKWAADFFLEVANDSKYSLSVWLCSFQMARGVWGVGLGNRIVNEKLSWALL